MSPTRDRLERRRRSPWRVLLVVVGAVVVALGVAAGVAVLVLPPVLAETPRERFEVATLATVYDDEAHAGVELSAGWLAIGAGPFLPSDRARFVSPDGAYRLELALLPTSITDAGTAAAPPAPASGATPPPAPTDPTTEDAPSAAPTDPTPGDNPSAAPTDPTPGDAPSAAPTAPAPADAPPAASASAPGERRSADPLVALLEERGLDDAIATAAWSTEALTSGASVRYTTVEHEEQSVTVAIVTAPDVTVARLALIATTDLADAARYRTVTADLVGSAVVARTEEPRS